MPRHVQKGQALVEFALTVPIFLMFVFGIIDLARAMFGFAQIADASRQAVRYGIVKGLDADVYQYIDCAGIRDAATDVPGLLDLDSSDIDVYWEDAVGTKIAECGDAVTHHDIQGGDVLVVRVHTDMIPLTPVLMMFDNSILIDYTTRRTITQNVAATDEWKDPPPAPTGFNAEVDCSLTTNNVKFWWTPISPKPDRIEIREVITGLVVAEPDPNNAYCNGCATISPTDGYGMYYLVAFNGTYPSELASAPSNQDMVMCPGAQTGPISIPVVVFDDKNGDTLFGQPEEKGIKDVRIFVYELGPNGQLDDEDPVRSLLTDKFGHADFYNLSNGLYQVHVGQSSEPVRSDDLTTLNDPYDITPRGRCRRGRRSGNDGRAGWRCTHADTFRLR